MDPGISVAMNTRNSKPISNQTSFSRKNYENQHIQRIKITKYPNFQIKLVIPLPKSTEYPIVEFIF